MKKSLCLSICSLAFMATISSTLPPLSAAAVTQQAKVVSTVKKAKAIAVTKVNLEKTTGFLDAGNSYCVKAAVAPANATNKTLIWSSSNKKVATVLNGTIKAVQSGTCKISVTSSNGKSATFVVIVKRPFVAVKSVTLSSKFVAVVISGTVQLKATINPVNATEKSIIWTSTNKNIATVNSNGLITGKAKGTCKIVAKSKPAHNYLVGAFTQTIATKLKAILPGSVFVKLMNDHYGIK